LTAAFFFVLNCRAEQGLDRRGYDADFGGLRGFDSGNLKAVDAHPMLIDVYDQIFRDR
jgi:hypothetical protein